MPKVGETPNISVAPAIAASLSAEALAAVQAPKQVVSERPTNAAEARPIKFPKFLTLHYFAESEEVATNDLTALRAEMDSMGLDEATTAKLAEMWAGSRQLAFEPMTMLQAMDFLGWETEDQFSQSMREEFGDQPGVTYAFGDRYHLKDYFGKKVRLNNNTVNREFREPWAKRIAQDILNKFWRFNGEAIIIGRTGLDLSGQHRLIGFVRACQMWQSEKCMKRWRDNWPQCPTLSCVVNVGVDESPETIRTLDNVLARTLADTVYTSPLFAYLDPEGRSKASRMMDAAVDLLWKRTALSDPQKDGNNQAWMQLETHSSAMEFLANHKRLEMCVKHLFDEDKGHVIGQMHLHVGKLAAQMYLMGCSTSDSSEYTTLETRHEGVLDWTNWEAACQFFTFVVKSEPVRMALAALVSGESKGSEAEQDEVIVRAWQEWLVHKDVKLENIVLTKEMYGFNKDGEPELLAYSDFGGIDKGRPKKAEGTGADGKGGDGVAGGDDEPSQQTKDEIQAEARRQRDLADAARLEAARLEKAAKDATKRAGDKWVPLKSKKEREAEEAAKAATAGVTNDTAVAPSAEPAVPEGYTAESLAEAQARLNANQPKEEAEQPASNGGGKKKAGKKPVARKA